MFFMPDSAFAGVLLQQSFSKLNVVSEEHQQRLSYEAHCINQSIIFVSL